MHLINVVVPRAIVEIHVASVSIVFIIYSDTPGCIILYLSSVRYFCLWKDRRGCDRMVVTKTINLSHV